MGIRKQVAEQKEQQRALYGFYLLGIECAQQNKSKTQIGNLIDLQNELENAKLVGQYKTLMKMYPEVTLQAAREILNGYNTEAEFQLKWAHK